MEVTYYVAASADGYIAAPDGGLDWLTPYPSAGLDHRVRDFSPSVDVVLMGRRAYAVSRALGGLDHLTRPAWVFTRQGLDSPGAHVRATAKNPARVVEELAETHAHAWLMGGGVLASSFQRAGLITAYRIDLVPVLLGEGIPLFGADGGTGQLRLTDVESHDSGIVELRYEG